ncbi:hypothetical protein FJT64_027554 [Amphibalanus amphitrite]|uniref:Uncharacterized protein n=1 Tax=Amphibalanus amphitrite TaxID=1232801 RepID=A0A6A4W049_AMPAM|nr:hypothetical protein FJT64_027554 [Amphibalanus amphitrite]
MLPTLIISAIVASILVNGHLGESPDRLSDNSPGKTIIFVLLVTFLPKARSIGFGVVILGGSLGSSVFVKGEPATAYVTRSVVHAERPLVAPVATSSAVACAMLCRRWEGCLKWSRRAEGPAAALCYLWPIHSADNPLTTAAETVYQYIVPPGYVLSPFDRRVAYGSHRRGARGGYGIISMCHEHDPESVPAFPTTDEQLRGLISMPFHHHWIGINDIEKEGVFMDLFNERNITVNPEWYRDVANNHFAGIYSGSSDCVVIKENLGLACRSCTLIGYPVCEYWP